MGCGDVLAVLFSGIGATLIGVYLQKRMADGRTRTTRVSEHFKVTTLRSAQPVVFQPSPPSPPPTGSVTGEWDKPTSLQYTPQYSDLRFTIETPAKFTAETVLPTSLQPCPGETIPAASYRLAADSAGFTVSSDALTKTSLRSVYSPATSFDFPPEVTNVVSFGDGAFALEAKFPGLEIRKNGQTFDLRGLENGLSRFQRDELFYADHWLVFQWADTAEPSASETVNLFLLSIWLAKPAKVNVQLRFEINQDKTSQQVGTTWVMQELFRWVPQDVSDHLSQSDLRAASTYFAKLRSIRLARQRLHHAIFLTYAGCVASNWAVALLCFASAAEALFTHSKAPGLTKRLSVAFACLTETRKADRDRAYSEFHDLYEVRSDIIHGRLYLRPNLDRLGTLARLQAALRAVWRAILPAHYTTLEGDDVQRRAFFKGLQGSYQAPL